MLPQVPALAETPISLLSGLIHCLLQVINISHRKTRGLQALSALSQKKNFFLIEISKKGKKKLVTL